MRGKGKEQKRGGGEMSGHLCSHSKSDLEEKAAYPLEELSWLKVWPMAHLGVWGEKLKGSWPSAILASPYISLT